MKLKMFKYSKDTSVKSYEVMILKEAAGSFEGISVGGIPEAERAEIVKIFKEFEERLDPYMKYYRRFNLDKIVPERLQEDTKGIE